MEDFNSKYTGEEVENLLDKVASGEGRKEVIYVGDSSDSIANMKPNVVYWIDADKVIIESFEAPSGGTTYDVFTAIIMPQDFGTFTLSLPENVRFANGEAPSIDEDTHCVELSISRISDNDAVYCHNAVLTKF